MRRASIAILLIVAGTGACRDTVADPRAASPLASIRIIPLAAWLHPGDTLRLHALPFAAGGAAIASDVRFTWMSAGAVIAAVDSSGLVTAGGLGDVEIVATADGERGTSLVHVVPAPPAPVVYRLMVAGNRFTCGVEPIGVVLCWGRNTHGQLGNGGTWEGAVPIAVNGLSNVRAIAAGMRHVCVLDGEGRPWCWGWNSMRQVGPWFDDKIAFVPEPAPIAGRFLDITAGSAHTCALRDDGTTFCWGANPLAQLGAEPASTAGPVRVSGAPPLVALAAGHAHTCGLDADGAVWCWGWNAYGQLGAPASTCPEGGVCSSVPLRVRTAERIRALAAGGDFNCGLNEAGAAFCWGANAVGQLGGAPGPNSIDPVRVGGVPPFVEVSAGLEHACGLTAEGALWCWGDNRHGQLGDGTGAVRTGPVLASLAPTPVLRFADGGAHSCAMDGAAVVTCWGANTFGQLGLNPAR